MPRARAKDGARVVRAISTVRDAARDARARARDGRRWTSTRARAGAEASTSALGSGLDFRALTRAGETASAAYARLCAEGVVREDEAQRHALKALDVVGGRARGTRRREGLGAVGAGGGWSFAGWLGGDASAKREVEAGEGGAYVHGGPGSGKTFVMDLFYATLDGEHGVEKRREHFHSFMLETHTQLHKLKDSDKNMDTVGQYASALARKMRVLCLDEFQIVDVADAMIIKRLLENLWAEGVLVVTTSNRHPDELYKNGLNRAQFLPCIAEIKRRCIVHEMASDRDYRLTGRARSEEDQAMWKSGGDEAERERWLVERLQVLAGERSFKPLQIAIGGRLVHVRRAGGGIAHFDFNELCDSALGAADYTALASIFNSIGVGHVPTLSSDRLDLVRRFITFIDVMYEHKVKLLVSADASPEELYRASAGDGSRKNAARDEEFAWDRAASRLAEMQSKEFQEAPWNPKAGSWLLEQARVTEVVPAQVLRSLWQRYDRNRDNVLDETELECLVGDLNQLRSGHRHVSEEQLDAVMSIVRGSKNLRENRYMTYEEFTRYGHAAMLECMRDR
jgi:predicted ATPase